MLLLQVRELTTSIFITRITLQLFSSFCFSQELIVLRAIRDANVPKFLMDDLKLFNGIVSDLFPKIRDVPVDYGEMEQSIRAKSLESGLEDVEG